VTIAESNGPIPSRITRIIRDKDLSRSVVAKRAGLSRQQLCDMLHGRRIIRPCDVMRLATALGVEISELYADGA